MATKTCPSCSGHGTKNHSISKGVASNICSNCGGSGQVQDYNAGGGGTGVRDCFPGEAMVLTPDGQKRIDSLGVGKIVLSLDTNSRLVPAKITRMVSHRRPHPILRVVSVHEDLSFFATKRHPVRTQRGWVRIKSLQPGDVLSYVTEKGEVRSHEVARVEKTERVEPVYNLIVDGDHTFLVQGCVAHSFVYFRRLRTFLNRSWRQLAVFPLRAVQGELWSRHTSGGGAVPAG